MKNFVKLDENYYLLTQKVNNSMTIETSQKVNHIFVIDVSGSMSHDLPLIRTQLKNKLSDIMKEGDTISIIWFSGAYEAGILKEEVEVKSLKTLNDLNNAIDKWLHPMNLTAFLKPLQLVKEVIERIKKNRPNSIMSLQFFTDGCNNNCSWTDVVTALKNIEKDLSASCIIEYGYYCDTQKLTQMSAILGGEKISCDNFNDFEPVFVKNLTKKIKGNKKIVVDITDKYLYDFAFSISENKSILLYNIINNKIIVGNDVNEIYFFSTKAIGEENLPHTAMYAAIYILSDKLLNDDVEKLFYALGDNYYYKMLVNAYGKQKLNEFKNNIKECVTDASKRFPEGVAKIKPVDENTYCLMNLINDLSNIDNCLFYPNHPDFIYNRIGRKKNIKSSNLSDTDKQKLTEAKNIEEANKILEELKEKNIDIKFVNTEPERGYCLSDLVWNENRANLSIRIKIDGIAKLPKNKFNIDEIATYKYNTFTLIKDGIVNVELLPVSYSEKLLEILIKNNVKYLVKGISTPKTTTNMRLVIDLTSLPIINKGMVKAISAIELAKEEWELLKIQANKKIFDFYKKSLFPKTSESYAQMLGQECADWLKTIGITDYNGFAPKTEFEESTDFYMSVNLETKIKGLSLFPKIEDVVAKVKDNKLLKLNEWILSDAIKLYHEQVKLYDSLSKEEQDNALRDYLTTVSSALNLAKKKIMQNIAECKFSLILSRKWFKEFKSFDDDILDLKIDNQELTFVFKLTEKEQKI